MKIEGIGALSLPESVTMAQFRGMRMMDKLLKLAADRGLSQGEVESHCALNRGRISKWKNDEGEPTARQALRMADLLEVPVRYLIDDAMSEPIPDLDERQSRVLWLAERVGYDRAINRLMGLPEPETETGKAPATPLGESPGPEDFGVDGTLIPRRNSPRRNGSKRRGAG